jgi:predicted permease
MSVFVWRATATLDAIAMVGGAAPVSLNVRHGSAPAERVSAAAVTANYFDVLGHDMLRGRGFTDADDAPGTTAVISSDTYRRRVFNGRAAVGETLLINGHRFTIIGVTAEHFRGPERAGETDLWVPIGSHLESMPQYPASLLTAATGTGARGLFFSLVARLAPGGTVSLVNQQLEALRTRLIAEGPGADFGRHGLAATPGLELPYWERELLPGMMRLILWASCLLLLLACANAANLLFARTHERQGELATRQALGAARRDVVAQLLTEGLLLALTSGTLALLTTVLVGQLLGGLVLSQHLPELPRVPIDWRVFVMALAASLLACLFASLAPAWLASRVAPSAALSASGRRTTRHNRVVRRGLMIVQVGVAVALLSAALLLVRSVDARYRVPLGYDPEGVLTFSIEPGVQGHSPADSRRLLTRLIADLRAVPGVAQAAMAWNAPFQLFGRNRRIRAEGVGTEKPLSMDANYVSSGFFATMRTPLHAGREFTATEGIPHDPLPDTGVILNVSAARALFGSADAVGRAIVDTSEPDRRFTVVGVAADMRMRAIDSGPVQPTVFGTFEESWGSVVVRLSAPAQVVLPQIREIVTSLDAGMPIYNVANLEDSVDRHLAEPRLLAGISTTLAGLAVLVSALGLYGVLLRNVEERRREFGIRTALGAQPGQIAILITREAFLVTAVGVIVGTACAYGCARVIQSRLFEVSPTDAASLMLAVALVFVMAALAALRPIRRAGALNVVDELRLD